MKISITDDDGVVFAIHDINRYTAHQILHLTNAFRFDEMPPDTEGSDVTASDFIDDLHTACRQEMKEVEQ